MMSECNAEMTLEDMLKAGIDTIESLQHERDLLLSEGAAKDDALELAWGIIANAYGGDWNLANTDWHGAAIRWRDNYHENLVSGTRE